MTIKKKQHWYNLDTSYRLLTYNLASQPRIDIQRTKTGYTASRGRFTFEVNEPDLEGIRFQLTSKDKLGVFAPLSTDIDEIIHLIKPILDQAAGKPVRLTPYYSSEGKREPVVEEADYEEVSRCIKTIKSTINVNVLHSRLAQLQALAVNKRLSHYPEVLETLQSSLGNQLVIQNIENFRLIIDTLIIILNFELEKDDKNVEAILKIKNDVSLKLVSLLKNESLEFLRYSLSLLGHSEKEEVVNLIFAKIESAPSNALDGVVDSLSKYYARALAKLYAIYGGLIDEKLDELIASADETKAKVGMELRKNIANQNLW
jgi:hypothetical protein